MVDVGAAVGRHASAGFANGRQVRFVFEDCL